MVRRVERWSGSVVAAAALSEFAGRYASLLEMDVRFPWSEPVKNRRFSSSAPSC